MKVGTEIQDFRHSTNNMVEGLIEAHASRDFHDAIMGGDERQMEDGFQQARSSGRTNIVLPCKLHFRTNKQKLPGINDSGRVM